MSVSPMTLVFGILVALLAWRFLTLRANAGTFATTLSKLPLSFQTAINLELASLGVAPMAATYNGGPMNFSSAQVISMNDYQGILFYSSDQSVTIYLTYYEFAIWTHNSSALEPATLSVPARTQSSSDRVITDNPTGGYSLTGLFPNCTITSLTGPVTPSLVNSRGGTVLLSILPPVPASAQ